jgi:hypothetical protein
VIYCVVPEELAPELYDKLTDYYAEDPNVTVIVDRRKGGRGEATGDRGPDGSRRERDRKPVDAE